MSQQSWMSAALVALAIACKQAPVVHAERLEPASFAGWTVYVNATESRMTRELGDGHRFLGIDFDADAASERAAVLGGQLLVRRLDVSGADGRSIDVPFGSRAPLARRRVRARRDAC
jgi:hypothetical protein